MSTPAREADPQRQRCKACGRVDYFSFQVDSPVWRIVVPPELRDRVVCLPCFDDFAKAKGIDYQDAMWDTLHFAGNASNIMFKLHRR